MLFKKEQNYLSKRYDIDIVASAVELCYLTKEPEKVWEFCSFMLGEQVHPENMREKKDEIMKLINDVYPDMKKTLDLSNGSSLTEKEIEEKVNEYKKKYGESLVMFSRQIEEVKKLGTITISRKVLR